MPPFPVRATGAQNAWKGDGYGRKAGGTGFVPNLTRYGERTEARGGLPKSAECGAMEAL